MTCFFLTRRLRSQDLNWLEKSPEAQLVVLGEALLSDFSGLPEKVKVVALQEEVKENGLVPQCSGELELKSGGDLVDLLLGAQVVHL